MSAVFENIIEYNAPYNKKNFDSLIAQLKDNNIVPYIGAGMSIINRDFYPPWNRFLTTGFNGYCIEKDINEFEKLDAEEKANFLYKNMGKLSFAEYLKDTFSEEKLKISLSELCKTSIYLIPLIFQNNLLVTTNYDKIIENMYMLQGKLITVLHPGHREALKKALRSNTLLLYKIHGDITEPQESIILTKEQYDNAYADTNLTEDLKDIFKGKQLLFIGCGLQEDRPLKLMQSILEAGMENYAIIPCDNDMKNDRRISLESRLNTKAIIYPEGQHHNVRVILEKIVELVNPQGFNSISTEKKFPNEINRFKYNSSKCDFLGRENEIKQLNDFCTSEGYFSWWCITAIGGAGKTRLAWEFEKIVKGKNITNMPNWNIVWDIPEKKVTMDTLIIIDDAFLRVKDLTNFIKTQCHSANTNKTRLLILDRNYEQLYKEMHRKSDLDGFFDESRYADTPVTLSNIETKEQIEISKSYSKSNRYNLSEREINNILSTLERVDLLAQRPLYLLFITDAVIKGNDVALWDRKDALDYVFEREEKILLNKIQKIIIGENPAIEKALWVVTFFVNFTGETSISLLNQENILKPYISNLNECLDFYGYNFESFIEKIGLLKDKNNLTRIEPHIIGEYVVIKIMERFAKKDIINILTIIWSNFDLSWQFIENLYSDFSDILKEKELSDYFENIEISPNIKKIRITAFWAQKHLKTVSIPESIEYINPRSFSYCDNLTKINVARDNKDYCSVDGIFFSKDMKKLIEYPCGRKNSEYVIPNNVVDVQISDNNHLKKVAFSSSVKKVRITECPQLEEVILNEGLEKIEDCAFNGCCSLQKINIPKSVSEVHPRAFNRCDNFNSIEVDFDNKYFYSKEGVLYSKRSQSLILYPFAKRDSEYIIEEGTKRVGDSAFSQNKYLQKVTIPIGTESIGSLAFGFCYALQIVDMPITVKKLERFVFSGCCNLHCIVLPGKLEKMGDQAFTDCKRIERISIPGSLSVVDYNSFAGCDNLKTVKLVEGVKKLERGSFSHCKNLKDITIPNSIINLPMNAFHETPIIRFHIKKDNSRFITQVGHILSRFVDDLFSINYVLVNDKSLIAVEDEIAASKITKLSILNNNEEGISVDYWYKDKECTIKWNYDDDLMPPENIYLYAKLENI